MHRSELQNSGSAPPWIPTLASSVGQGVEQLGELWHRVLEYSRRARPQYAVFGGSTTRKSSPTAVEWRYAAGSSTLCRRRTAPSLWLFGQRLVGDLVGHDLDEQSLRWGQTHIPQFPDS